MKTGAESVRCAPDRELLLAQHRFPGEYTIKAFGPGRSVFRQEVRVAISELNLAVLPQFSERESSSGKRVCVSVHMTVDSVDEVIEAYERLYQLQELLFVL